MFRTIEEIFSTLHKGELNPEDLVTQCLDRIHKLNPRLNVFISIAERENQRMDLGLPLTGVPVAVKDLIDVRGLSTTAGTSSWSESLPETDAEVVKRLKQAGASMVGKTNLHEIALGVTNVNPHFGACRNPWDLQRISGGSSGGSAVAVASGMVPAALGTDTGGSIRIPAALCGVVGLKPTYGRVSLRGVVPLSWTLDHVGPITRTVRDAASLLQVMAGYDPLDPASFDQAVGDYQSELEKGVQGFRIGFAVGDFIEAANEEVLATVRKAVSVFEELGASIQQVQLPWLEQAAQANTIITQADGAAFHRERLDANPHAFGEDVLRRLKAGRGTLSGDYAIARRTQVEIKRRFKTLFEEFDLLLLPTTPDAAPFIEGPDAVAQARRLTRFTAPFNLTGLPALSLPCGFSKDGLPIGLQVVGAEWAEATVLQAGRAYEKATPWHERWAEI